MRYQLLQIQRYLVRAVDLLPTSVGAILSIGEPNISSMNSKSDVNRRVLAIQAKKKRHKGNKKRGKQQQANGAGGTVTGAGAGSGGVAVVGPSTNNSDQMHHTSNAVAGSGSGSGSGSKTHFVNISPTLAATEKLCKASVKSESLKLLAGEGKAAIPFEPCANAESIWSKEKMLSKDGRKANNLHHPKFKPHHQYGHSAGHAGNENENDNDEEDDEDLDAGVDDADGDEEDDEECAGAGANNAATSRTSLTMDGGKEKAQPAPYLGTPSNESDDDEDGEEESEANSENEEQELKKDYRKGGYHPVNIGDLFQGIHCALIYSFSIMCL